MKYSSILSMMKAFTLFAPLFFLFTLVALDLVPVPYSGKVAINGVNYHGNAEFTFFLGEANGTVHWRNGVNANDTIKVFALNGRYTLLLVWQGMNPLSAKMFLDVDELYLKVHFDNNVSVGLRHLTPDQQITAKSNPELLLVIC